MSLRELVKDTAKFVAIADVNKVVGKLQTKLDKKSKDLFIQSCFGQFLSVKEQQFQGQLYLHLMLNQTNTDAESKLTFKVCDMVAEFGPTEFSMITGLRFSRYSPIPSTSTFYDRIFPNRKELFLRDIYESLERKYIVGEDRLKIALLLVLYGLLISGRKANDKLDTSFIHLLDKMEDFNSYPWCRLAFEMLVENFNEVKKVHIDRKINTHIDGPVKKEYIVCSRFTLAIQLWAYEAIPRLAGCSAFPTMEAKGRLPRMLWWSSSDKPSFKLLNKKVFQPRKKHKTTMFSRLQPTELEKQSESFKSAVEWENTIHSEGRVQMMNIDAMKMNMRGEGSSGDMQQESLREIVKTEVSRCLDDRYKQLHQDNEKLVNIINLLINQMGGMQGTGLAGSTAGGIDIRKVDYMRRPNGTSNVVQSPQRSHTTATPAVSCTDANHTVMPTGIDVHGYTKTPQTEVKHIDNGVQREIAIQWNVDGEFHTGCSEFKYLESDLSNSASESTVRHHSVCC